MVITRIKLANVPAKAIPHAITVASKVICRAIVRKLRRKGHVTNVVRRAICLVNVQKAVTAVAEEDHRARNATSAGK